MIRKLESGKYRLYSKKVDPRTGRRRNLGTFATRAAAEDGLQVAAVAGGVERVDQPRLDGAGEEREAEAEEH